MDRNESRFTVLFQSPFWVGIAERWSGEGYQAARVVFGAEPTDAQVYQWLLGNWRRLPFTAARRRRCPKPFPPIPSGSSGRPEKAAQTARVSTKAQQALARQREAEGLERRARRAAQKRAEQEEQFRIRQRKKREKRRGH